MNNFCLVLLRTIRTILLLDSGGMKSFFEVAAGIMLKKLERTETRISNPTEVGLTPETGFINSTIDTTRY
jgi:hypothetical protein